MRKKLIFQRNLRKGGGVGPPYLKYLVITAVSLTILVVVVPYLIKGKSKGVPQRPVPKKGAITKEIPKQPARSAPEKLSELGKPAEQARPPETKPLQPAMTPEAIKPMEVQLGPKPTEWGLVAPQKPSTAEAPSEGNATAPENAPSTQSAKPAPKDLFPKKNAPPEAPATAALTGSAKTGAKAGPPTPPAIPAPPTPPAKPAPSTEKGGYAVQVGTIFKERSQAERVRKDLAEKGYKAVTRTAADGRGYIVATSPGSESKAYTLLEQMKIQGLNDTKVIKVSPGS